MFIDNDVIEGMVRARFADDEIIAIGNYINKLIDIAFKNYTMAMTQYTWGDQLQPVDDTQPEGEPAPAPQPQPEPKVEEELKFEELPKMSDEEWTDAPEGAEIELPDIDEDKEEDEKEE